jgi:hypothetical protein
MAMTDTVYTGLIDEDTDHLDLFMPPYVCEVPRG